MTLNIVDIVCQEGPLEDWIANRYISLILNRDESRVVGFFDQVNYNSLAELRTIKKLDEFADNPNKYRVVIHQDTRPPPPIRSDTQPGLYMTITFLPVDPIPDEWLQLGDDFTLYDGVLYYPLTPETTEKVSGLPWVYSSQPLRPDLSKYPGQSWKGMFTFKLAVFSEDDVEKMCSTLLGLGLEDVRGGVDRTVTFLSREPMSEEARYFITNCSWLVKLIRWADPGW